MRSLLVIVLLIASFAPLPSASAAGGLAEDPSGDTQTRVFGGPTVPAATPAGEAADLLLLEAVEDAEQISFTLKVQGLQQSVNFVAYQIHFSWAKDEYDVVVYRQTAEPVVGENTNAYLVNTEDNDWDRIANLEHELDLESGRITVHVPKAYLLGEKGRYPLLGDKLEDLWVEASSSMSFFNFGADAYDRMPDGEGMSSYEFLFGDLATGHLRLDADERVRVSNGGATTFVYQVAVVNKGDADDQVDITLSEMPEGWNGTVQSPLRVPAGAERRIAVLVSMPFAHEHGGFSSFNVTATSESDPGSVASVRLGVLHTPIPQPAGHHAELYLHAENLNGGIFGDVLPWNGASMNTDGMHDADAPEASPWGGGDGYSWKIKLAPGLRMGLDFDLEQLGELAGNVIGHTTGEGTFRAELLLTTNADEEAEGDGILLMESDEQPGTLDLSAPTPFKLTLTPTEEADYIPYAKGQNLVLWLYFDGADDGIGNICCLPGTTPGLVTADFKMKLPLNEYHDKLNGLSEAGDLLELKAEGPVEKTGLPGTTMTYAFTLINHGAASQVIDLDLAGTDALLGTLVPSESVELGSKERRKLTVAVSIPTDKNDGEELEVLVFAHAQDDPSKSAIARTKTIVGKTGAPDAAADETGVLLAAQQAESNDTPAAGAILSLAALAAVALAMRRRRA